MFTKQKQQQREGGEVGEGNLGTCIRAGQSGLLKGNT